MTNPKRTEVVILIMAGKPRAVFYSVEEAEGFLLENTALHLPYELATCKILHSDLSDPQTTVLDLDE